MTIDCQVNLNQVQMTLGRDCNGYCGSDSGRDSGRGSGSDSGSGSGNGNGSVSGSSGTYMDKTVLCHSLDLCSQHPS